jgi:hypothetical protein
MLTSDNFRELEGAAQRHLIEFLLVELELAETMCDILRTTTERDQRNALIRKLRLTLLTIRNAEVRLTDPLKWKEIHERANRLEVLIDAIDSGARCL